MEKTGTPFVEAGIRELNISVYERYLLCGKELSSLIDERCLQKVNLYEGEDYLALGPGTGYEIGHKNKRAVIYSKPLASFLREKLNFSVEEGARKLKVELMDDYLLIPTKIPPLPTKR